MGKQSTRENKTIYQLCREAAGLTRAEASERMDAVSDSKIVLFSLVDCLPMRISSPYIAKHEDYQYLSPHARRVFFA